ncbi:hypothetical protein, partial [Parasutterella excrementihominis]|uniref:hypothetical protein n=1 Tax=Parasutterella excrementihominis TaxID=487175 RepID=UPI003AAB8EF2
FANVRRGFVPTALLLPLRAFNHRPQSAGLGSASRGACAFPTNVVPEQRTEASQLEAFTSLGL